jgi:hypothetical protein
MQSRSGSFVLGLCILEKLAIASRQLIGQVVKFVISHVFRETREHSFRHVYRIVIIEDRSFTDAIGELYRRNGEEQWRLLTRYGTPICSINSSSPSSSRRRIVAKYGTLPSSSVPDLDRLGGMRVDDPDIISDAWDAAFDADKPVVLDVITDPHVPPLPPHINFEQASNFTKDILKRDPDGLQVMEASVKQLAASAIQRGKNRNG